MKSSPKSTAVKPAATVVFLPNDKGNPPDKLADAELHFSSGRSTG